MASSSEALEHAGPGRIVKVFESALFSSGKWTLTVVSSDHFFQSEFSLISGDINHTQVYVMAYPPPLIGHQACKDNIVLSCTTAAQDVGETSRCRLNADPMAQPSSALLHLPVPLCLSE